MGGLQRPSPLGPTDFRNPGLPLPKAGPSPTAVGGVVGCYLSVAAGPLRNPCVLVSQAGAVAGAEGVEVAGVDDAVAVGVAEQAVELAARRGAAVGEHVVAAARRRRR